MLFKWSLTRVRWAIGHSTRRRTSYSTFGRTSLGWTTVPTLKYALQFGWSAFSIIASRSWFGRSDRWIAVAVVGRASRCTATITVAATANANSARTTTSYGKLMFKIHILIKFRARYIRFWPICRTKRWFCTPLNFGSVVLLFILLARAL